MRVFVAEFIGIFIITFVGAGAMLQSAALKDASFGLLGIAVANGIAVSIAVSAFAVHSGAHYNPAVSVGLAATGRIPWKRVPLYVAAQLLGSVVAAACLAVIFPAHVVATASLGTPAPGPGVSMATVLLVEFILTAILMLAIWGTAIDPRAPAIGGFGIGLTVLFEILVGGPISGAAMNPARVFGPALVGGVWEMHGAYWVAPTLGAVAGALVYRHLLLGHPPETAPGR